MSKYSVYSLALITALGVCATVPSSFADEAHKSEHPSKTHTKTDKNAVAKPVGHIHFRTQSADLGVGYTWGEGTLTYKGKKHRFAIHGGNIAALGYSKINANGEVYNLKHLHDFDGEYGSAAGEATVNKGLGGALLSNTNGVRLKITSSNRGARLAAGLQGLHFTLKN